VRYAIELSYDGSRYHGWQSQNNAITVQQELNSCLSQILREDVTVTGCGRTDTGVHASHFIAHFDLENPILDRFVKRINGVLPDDIAVQAVYEVPDTFNARFDALSRTYEYHIQYEKSPFNRVYSYLYFRPLDLDKMLEACDVLKRHTEFGAFCKSNAQNHTNFCTIYEATWKQKGSSLIFVVKANRFLRNMVRAIVGTMLEVGENKITVEGFEDIIESQNRQKAGYSVPAKGLFLHRIDYDTSDWKLIT
jgi:tRNA pseudouridine38-40 synthase